MANGQEEILERLFKEEHRSRWLVLGEVVRDLEEQFSVSAPQISWLRVAVNKLSEKYEPLGMSYAYKLIRTYKFLTRIALNKPEFEPVNFDGCPLGAIEIATRIHKFDPFACERALLNIKDGASAADVMKLYDAAKSRSDGSNDARNNAWSRNQDLARKSINFLRANMETLIATSHKDVRVFRVRSKQKSNGVGVSFYCVWRDQHGSEKVTGFDVFNIDGHPSSWFSSRAKVCFNSTFFDSYWMVAQCQTSSFSFIVEDLSALQVSNVGIINLGAANTGVVILNPTGRPVPDRTHLF